MLIRFVSLLEKVKRYRWRNYSRERLFGAFPIGETTVGSRREAFFVPTGESTDIIYIYHICSIFNKPTLNKGEVRWQYKKS